MDLSRLEDEIDRAPTVLATYFLFFSLPWNILLTSEV